MQLKLEYTLQRLIRKWGTQKNNPEVSLLQFGILDWNRTYTKFATLAYWRENGDKKKVPLNVNLLD